MSDKYTKMILFGEDFAEGFSDLNLSNLINFKDLGIEDDDMKKEDEKKANETKRIHFKNKVGNRKEEIKSKRDEFKAPFHSKIPQEKDLDLKLICTSDGEKIYKLSDLFVPKDKRVIKKIEKYNNRIMTISEKDKGDKDDKDHCKKDYNEAEELKNLVRKSKRNQKFTKINVTYNEKFFDRTFFLENIHTDNKTNPENINDVTITENFKVEQDEESVHKSTINKDSFKDNIIESNLLNALYFIDKKLEQDNRTKEDTDDDKTDFSSEIEVENKEILNLNKTIKFNIENNLFNNPNEMEVEEENLIFNINNKELKNTIYPDKFANEISLKDSKIFKDFFCIQENKSNMTFHHSKDSIDSCELFDLTKRKRYRAQGYKNEKILNGDFIKCILYSDNEVSKSFKQCAKRIFDMNDYNMSFEVLKQDMSQDKQRIKEQKEAQEKRELNMTMNSNTIGPAEDFFVSFANQKQGGSGGTLQPTLKIGKTKSNLLTHAKCAYNLTYNKINLTYEDLKDFHRPNFAKWLLKEKKKRNFSFTISDKFNISHGTKSKRWDCNVLTRNYLKKKEKKRLSKNIQYMNAYEIFKDRFKLSLVDGKYCLFEHIDEYPLFVSNFGMASKLKKFLYTPRLFNSNVSSSTTKLSETELKTYNIAGPYGSQILLHPNQKLPLIGQVELSDLKGLSLIDNKMYRAPVFYEKLKPPTQTTQSSEKKYYNFLITFKKSKNGKEGFYIRELEHHYTVGQEEPKIEVYPPQSRQYCNFLKNKIKTYTFKLYDEIGYKAGINFKVFTNLFPNATEQILKKNFREMKIEIDKNICYFTKLPNEENQTLVTPENVCQFESCQFGVYKLREVGIKNLTNPDKISYATNKFITQTQNIKQQFLGKVIEEELLTTPWNITQNFLQAKQIKGMLSIKGIGDPSNGMGGYSFLKMPVKSYNDNKTLKEEIDQLKTMNKNIKTVTGTDADLRRLSKDEIKLKLIQLGEEEDYINKLTRWERVSLLRYKSSKAAELGYEGDITKYARGARMNSKIQRDAYQKNINEVFKKQIHYITGENNQNNTDESSDEENENKMIVDDSDKLDQETEIDEKKKSHGFMRNEIYSNTSVLKKKKKDGKRNGIITNEPNKNEGIIKIYKKNQADNLDEGATKIKFDMKSIDIEYLKRKKKNSQSFDNVYEYEIDKTASLISRKRRDTPEKTFNELLEDIIDSCTKFDSTKIFHQPVKKKEYGDYYKIIKNPIDLSIMKNKTKRFEYKTGNELINDFNLMVENSLIYNGEGHEVTAQGRRIRDYGFTKIQESIERIKECEERIVLAQIANNPIIINP